MKPREKGGGRVIFLTKKERTIISLFQKSQKKSVPGLKRGNENLLPAREGGAETSPLHMEDGEKVTT